MTEIDAPDDGGDGRIENNVFTFGNDMIFGGGGRDTIYGDFLNLQLVADIALVVDGGTVVATDDNGNIFEFGNDHLFGGGAADTFSFTLLPFISGAGPTPDSMIMQGNDVIEDFEFSKDTIQFVGLEDLNGDGDVDIDDLAETTTASSFDSDLDGVIDMVFINFNDEALDPIGSILIMSVDPVANPLPDAMSIVDLAGVIDIV